MNCLECTTAISVSSVTQTAIGCCVHCGAAVCLDHARFVSQAPRPIGVIPAAPNGCRRVICTGCDDRSDPDRLIWAAITAPRDRQPHRRRSRGALLSPRWRRSRREPMT